MADLRGISRRAFLRNSAILGAALTVGCGNLSEQIGETDRIYFIKSTPEIFDGTLINLQAVTSEVYRQYPQAQADDFLLVFPNFEVHNMLEGIGAWYRAIRNDVKGIGVSEFDKSGDYDSNGNLRGVVTVRDLKMLISNPDTQGTLLKEGLSSLMLHEISHSWLAYIGETDYGIAETPHYLQTFLNTAWVEKVRGDNSVENYRRVVDPNGGSKKWFQVSGEQWRDVSCYDIETEERFCALSLYLMGLMDAEEHDGSKYPSEPEGGVLSKLVDIKTDPMQDTPCQFDMWGTEVPVTLQEVARAFGARYPTSRYSQKGFKIGVVGVISDKEFSDLEIGVINATINSLPGKWSNSTGGRSMLYL